MSKKQKRWRISDIMDAIVREHEARGVDVSEHDYGNMKPCPRCAAEAREFARLHNDADPLYVIRGRNTKFAAALRVWVEDYARLNEKIADKLVDEARRLNVPMNG